MSQAMTRGLDALLARLLCRYHFALSADTTYRSAIVASLSKHIYCQKAGCDVAALPKSKSLSAVLRPVFAILAFTYASPVMGFA